MNNNSNISRRNLLQNLALASSGFGLTQLISCKDQTSTVNKEKEAKELLPFYLPPAEPLQPGPGGHDIRILLKSSQTNMQYSCVEISVAPKKMGPPPHLHDALDEVMLVLEGTATVWMNGEVQDIQAGGWHIRPGKIPHTFWNTSDKHLRFVDMFFNQDFEDYLEEYFHKIIPDMIKNNLTPTDPRISKQMADLDHRFGVTMFSEKRQPLIDKYGLKA